MGNSEQPNLYSVLGNDIDGDLNNPIRSDIQYNFDYKKVRDKKEHEYMMLSRLATDCDFYLGHGNRNPDNLWEETEDKHVNKMKDIWNSFTIKEQPEWLTWDQIMYYESQMVKSSGIK